MRKGLLFGIVFITALLFLFAGCGRIDEKAAKGTMIVDGDIITNDEIVFYKSKKDEYVQVPLLLVLGKAGCYIERETPELVYIINKGKKYVLDFESKALTAEDEKNNLLISAPGSNHFICTFTYEDVLVDNVTLKSICYFMNVSASIRIDFGQKTISISKENA